MARSFRFGCVVRQAVPTRSSWLDRIRTIDGLGFDVVLCPDHLGMWPPFAPLVAAAEASERLRFGTQVLNVELWNPALLAREVAAVDVLTDGRLELGLGAGHAEVEFRAAGLRYPPPAERVDHLEEAVPLVRRLLAGETVTASGAYPLEASATGLETTQAHIPLMIGGNGDRVLDLAGREADIAGLVGITSGTGQIHTDLSHFGWDGLADRVARVHRAAGERAGDVELSVLVQAVLLTDERAEQVRRLAERFEQPQAVVGDSPFVMIGSTAQLADHLHRLRDDAGVTYVTVFEDAAQALGNAISRL
jgi:probable F420-dependent oxidoreductase